MNLLPLTERATLGRPMLAAELAKILVPVWRKAREQSRSGQHEFRGRALLLRCRLAELAAQIDHPLSPAS